MNDTLYTAAALIIPLVIAIVFHEVAHGWVARMLGDHTAARAGRLTLNPIKHVDPFGTLILPGMLWLTTHTAFGWAKPVPVNKWRLRNPRFGMMAVAAAGPATNFVLAAIGALLLGLLLRSGESEFNSMFELIQRLERLREPFRFIGLSLILFVSTNIFLAFFNLLPIPPFDGSHIVEGLLPANAARAYERLRPYGFPMLIVLLLLVPWLFPSANIIERLVVPPVEWLRGLCFELASAVAGI